MDSRLRTGLHAGGGDESLQRVPLVVRGAQHGHGRVDVAHQLQRDPAKGAKGGEAGLADKQARCLHSGGRRGGARGDDGEVGDAVEEADDEVVLDDTELCGGEGPLTEQPSRPPQSCTGAGRRSSVPGGCPLTRTPEGKSSGGGHAEGEKGKPESIDPAAFEI